MPKTKAELERELDAMASELKSMYEHTSAAQRENMRESAIDRLREINQLTSNFSTKLWAIIQNEAARHEKEQSNMWKALSIIGDQQARVREHLNEDSKVIDLLLGSMMHEEPESDDN